MKVTKRQLQRIIKEERSKVLKEQTGAGIYSLPDFAELFMLAVTDEQAAMDWLREYTESRAGLPGSRVDAVSDEELAASMRSAISDLKQFAEDLEYSIG